MAATSEIRKVNKRNIYRYIYSEKECAKQDLAAALGLSLPTVTQNISELMAEGLIRTAGHFESAGGRKPVILQCVPDARVAIGVEVLERHTYLCILDLYGSILEERMLSEPYRNSDQFFAYVGGQIRDLADSSGYPKEHILGAAIAVQGIVSRDHNRVTYGRILQNTGLTAYAFGQHFDLPCILLHDAAAAAFAESFHQPSLQDACYFFLNRNLGSALIMNSEIYGGSHARGQLLEHTCLVPGGLPCYCGQRGCAEGYCSAGSLERITGENLDIFFANLREGSPERRQIWEQYLLYLAQVLYNVLMTIDVNIVIGGKIRQYMKKEDVDEIRQLIRERSDFPISDKTISLETTMSHTAANGAGLMYIREFLDQY